MAKQQVISSITALPRSPQDDRRSRMTKYLIAMGIRLVCIVLVFVVPGWWAALFAVGAIVLPYLAVVLANVGHERKPIVLRPGSIVLVRAPPPAPNGPASTESPETGDQR